MRIFEKLVVAYFFLGHPVYIYVYMQRCRFEYSRSRIYMVTQKISRVQIINNSYYKLYESSD